MNLGISVTPYLTVQELVQVASEVENLGFDSFWLHDFGLWRDVFIALSHIAIKTTKITLGTEVTNFSARHPAITATAIRDVAELSAGRTILGIGVGGKDFLHSLGLEKDHQLQRTREGVHIIRGILSGQIVDIAARFYSSHGAHLNLMSKYHIPIYLPATGPKMLQLAGEIANGIILNVGVLPEVLKWAIDKIRSSTASRTVEGAPRIALRLDGVAVSDDPTKAKKVVRQTLPLLIANLPKEILELSGIPCEHAREIHRAYYSGDHMRASQMISLDMVDTFTIAGSPEECRDRLRELERLAIHEIHLTPISVIRNWTLTELLRQVERELIVKH